MVIEHEEIKRFLRQRAPFLLVDRITYIDSERIEGIKSVSGNDPFLQGHFDDEPILPGVILIEVMAQVGGVLVAHDARFTATTGGFLAGIDRVKFKKFVIPGDQIVVEADSLSVLGKMARLKARARVSGRDVACAEISYYLR